MSRLIRGLVLAALTAVMATVAVTQDSRESGDAQAHHREVHSEAKKERLRPGCRKHYRMKRFYTYTKTRYKRRSQPLTKGQKKHIRHLAFCLANKKKTRWAFKKKAVWRKGFRQRLAYYRLTPYVCPNGTRWAIPCYIVACESGYSWYAYNPSGARGPYQLLGWGAIYPARTWAAKMQNHRIASRVWNGGAGRSNWVC